MDWMRGSRLDGFHSEEGLQQKQNGGEMKRDGGGGEKGKKLMMMKKVMEKAEMLVEQEKGSEKR